MKKLLVILLFTGLIAGCYYDNEEALYPVLDQACDTTGVAFAKSILPILQTNCLGCHGTNQAAASGSGIDLGTFSSLKQVAVSGRLFGAIVQDANHFPMPRGGFKLDTCSITKIKIWIDKGALNN
jgi:mono/diheme cytochrome c family protein